MYVRVCAIGVDDIALAKASLHSRIVIVEVIHVNGTGDGLNSRLRKGQLVEQPGLGHDAVCVGVSQPALP